jgi:hypothetical protein
VAWGLVGETLGVVQIVGGVIVLSGALLAQTVTVAPSAVPERVEPEPVSAGG